MTLNGPTRYVSRFAPPPSECTATALPTGAARAGGDANARTASIETSAHPARLTPGGTSASLAGAEAASVARSRQRQPALRPLDRARRVQVARIVVQGGRGREPLVCRARLAGRRGERWWLPRL